MNQRRRLPLFSLSCLIGLAVLLGQASLSWAPRCVGCTQAFLVTSSQVLPFTGTVFDGDTGEDVTLTGQVHLVTQVDTQSLMLVAHANLPAIFGHGESTGSRYLANGAFEWPPDPVGGLPNSVSLTAEFHLWPPGPVRGTPAPLRCTFDLTIDANGTLQEGVVTVISSNGP